MKRRNVLGFGFIANLILSVGNRPLVWAEEKLTLPVKSKEASSTTQSTQDAAPDLGDLSPADEDVNAPPMDVPNEPEQMPKLSDVSQHPLSDLEGTSWTVKVTPDALAKKKGEKSFDDTLIFANGTVTMTACVKAGFAPSGYTASRAGEVWLFKTEQTSKKEGQTVWFASLSGSAIKGTMTWTKPDGTILHYAVEGKNAENKTPTTPSAP